MTAAPDTIGCALCEEELTGQVRSGMHIECLALGIIGHEYGVCSCTGWDTGARASALELWRRLGTETPAARRRRLLDQPPICDSREDEIS